MMNIHFSGITQAASDHDCQDGEMSILMNLLHENGTLIPLTTAEDGDDPDPAAERQQWSERCGMNVNEVVRCGRLICLVGDDDTMYAMPKNLNIEL